MKAVHTCYARARLSLRLTTDSNSSPACPDPPLSLLIRFEDLEGVKLIVVVLDVRLIKHATEKVSSGTGEGVNSKKHTSKRIPSLLAHALFSQYYTQGQQARFLS